MSGALINSGQINTQGINGTSLSQGITASQVVIFNQSGITLNWSPVTNALAYFVEVSLYADFRTVFESATVSQSIHTFTDSQISGQKRFWRYAPTLDGVTKFEPWSEVGSYWLDTALSAQLELARNEWAIANPSDMLDFYEFEINPTWVHVKRNLYRSQERNLRGDLLSEFRTIKGLVTLNFTGQQFMEMTQLSEIERFHNDFRTFFLACFVDGKQDRPMPHVWKVEILNDPSFTMISAGNPMYLQGSITFEEA